MVDSDQNANAARGERAPQHVTSHAPSSVTSVARSRIRALGAALSLAAAAAIPLTVIASPAEAADRRTEATELVADATETTAYFAADTAFEPLWDLADKAKAMVIIPESFRAGFIIGGSAGDAVMIARNDDGTWTQPTFLTVGSLSFGLQAGGEASETILLVMTERGMEQLLSTSVKLGADLSVAAGPIGAGAKAQTTDILAFSRSRGLYGGISLEGAVLKTRRKWNSAYYGTEVSPAEVIFRNDVYNPASGQLQNAVWRLANRNAPPRLSVVRPQPLDGGRLDGLDGGRLDGLDGAPAPRDANRRGDLSGDDLGDDYEDDAVWGAPIGRTE